MRPGIWAVFIAGFSPIPYKVRAWVEHPRAQNFIIVLIQLRKQGKWASPRFFGLQQAWK